MHGWAGFATLCIGLGVTAYVFHPGFGNPDVAGMIGTALHADAVAVDTASGAAASRNRTFSPRSPLFAPAETVAVAPPSRAPSPVAATAAGAAVGSRVSDAAQAVRGSAVVSPDPVPVATVPAQPWVAIVTTAQDPAQPRSTRPAGPEARADLVRDLQRELRRVGCYDGEIDGSWGGGSKRAMSAFNERVNATLPVEDPDYILLTLLRGHRDATCGATCPAGQSLSDGRCQPQGLIALAARKARSSAAAKVANAGSYATGGIVIREEEHVPGHATRSEGASTKSADAREPRQAAPASAARAAADPASADGEPSVAVAPTRRVAERATAPGLVSSPEESEPLPGRMTIGGPLAPAVAAPGSVAVVAPSPADTAAAPILRAPPQRHGNAGVHANRPVHAPLAGIAPRRATRPQQYASAASRQRNLVYNLFLRPDRAGN